MTDKLDNRSLGDLLAELSRETGVLVRKEVELAATEMTAKLKTAGTHAAAAVVGGALAHAGVLVLLAAVVIGLSQMGVTMWLAALIVAILTMLVGYVLVNRAMANMRRTSVAPTQTIETLKENARWTTGQRA
ncbi:MAG: phage holin family protein [Acidobacteria bacterium]|nr:phage holin family protein [Acidobacteriota bacterium]MCA1651150.1 phage holin family protein [Acidobacteriota bacterium]